MNRLSNCGLQAALLTALFATSLLFDPFANQTFREPKMLALLWLAATCLAIWGLGTLAQVYAGREVARPALPFLGLLPLIPILVYRFYLDFTAPDIGFDTRTGWPPMVSYRTHILLPVLAWFSVCAMSSVGFANARSRRVLGCVVFFCLMGESCVVFAEILENQTGWRTNPLGFLGTVEVGGGSVKERIFGTIGNPNFVAGYLAVCIPPVLGWALGSRRFLGRTLVLVGLLPVIAALLTTRSKGAILALLFGLAHFAIGAYLLRNRKTPSGQPSRISGGRSRKGLRAAGAALLLVGAVATGLWFAERTSNPEEGSYLGRWTETLSFRGDSIAVRALLAHCGFRMWAEQPWTGYGPGGFKVNFLESLKDLLESPEGEAFMARVARLHSLRANHLHNEYLQVLVETGVLGLVFLEFFLVWCQFHAFGLIRNASDDRDRWTRLGLLSGFWCGLGGSFFDLPLHRPAQAVLLAVLLGAALAPRTAGWFCPAACRQPIRLPRRMGAFLVGAIVVGMGCVLANSATARYVALREVFEARLVLEGKIPADDFKKVETTLRRVHRLVPGEGDYTLLLARYFLLVENDPAEAIAQIRKARLTCDDPMLYFLEAQAQVQRGGYDAATPLLAFLEMTDPDLQGLHALKGRCLQKQGRYKEACVSYKMEIDLARSAGGTRTRDVEQSYYQLANLLERELGRYSEAVRYYEDFLDLQGENPSGYPYAQLQLGAMFRDRFFNLERAKGYFERAHKILKDKGDRTGAENVRKKILEIEDRQRKAAILE